MATNKSRLTQAEKQLDAKLDALQNSCVQWVHMHYVSQQQERENLAEIYYWWKDAYKIPAYYNAKLAHLPPEQRRSTTDKFNFGPVLRLFYGVNTLDDTKRSRMSAALNAIHDEWQSKPKLYKQDVAKLANYIDQNKGVTGLAKQQAKIAPSQAPSEDITTEMALDEHEAEQAVIAATDDEDSATSFEFQEQRRRRGRPQHVDITDTHRKEALLDDAEDYWRKANGIASFDLDFGIEANKRKYSLALVRVDGEKLAVINSSIDEQIIKAVLLASYRKQFASVPKNLRCLLEVLRTQFIDGKVAAQLSKVPELGFDVNSKNEKIEIFKRVIFIPAANQLLLSPVSSKSGVVTLAVPSSQYLNVVDGDFYLPSHCKFYLSNRLLSNDDINQFAVASVPKVMAMHKAPCVVYTMKLSNKAMPADFAYIDIVSFAASTGKSKEYSQVALNEKYISAIKSKVKVSSGVMHKLAKQYADKWLKLKGNHANRPENELCTFAVGTDAFEFEIFDKKEDIGADPVCPIGKKLKLASPYKHYFKCRDLMPALSGMGALQLVGDVEVLLDDNVIVFKYSTGVASYTTAIPTVSKQSKKRSEKAFVVYQPKPYVSHANAANHTLPADENALTPVYCHA